MLVHVRQFVRQPKPVAAVPVVGWEVTAATDCLEGILILGRRHLEHVLRVYRRHYSEPGPHRAQRALELVPA